jgi:cysteinyl-tRNA synthetase
MIAGVPPRFYNSLGRELVEFVPMVAGTVGLYTCGMTVYADPHLGNMRPYVFSDTLRRLLEWKGLRVVQVVNITDVGHTVGEADLGEDKVEVAARKEARSVWDVTAHYTKMFFDDITALNVQPQAHNPRASEYVPQMIEFAKELDAKGFTYQLESGLYFDTAKSAGYGRLALRPDSGQLEGARLDVVPGKRSPADFAVWRAERGPEKRLVHWDSPWGPGVPGWHLECSVMSMELLGTHFDIHTGGIDHREIHHVNEIAQSEAYLGEDRDWVPLWMHNEFLLIGNQKMAKSGGRMPLLRELVAAGYHPLVYRYFLLTAHYRSQLDLTDAGLRSSSSALRRLVGRVAELRPLPSVTTLAQAREALGDAVDGPAGAALHRVDAAMSDDLNTPRVLAELNSVLRDEALADHDRAVLVAVIDQLLGLELGQLSPDDITTATGLAVSEDYIDGLVTARSQARAAGDWAEADRLREQLAQLGVRVMDTPNGSRWQAITEALD